MAADVVSIGGGNSERAGKPNAELIESVKKLLELAESGQMQRLAACWIEADGSPIDMMSPGGMPHSVDIVALIGSLELCKTTIATHIALNHLEPQSS